MNPKVPEGSPSLRTGFPARAILRTRSWVWPTFQNGGRVEFIFAYNNGGLCLEKLTS